MSHETIYERWRRRRQSFSRSSGLHHMHIVIIFVSLLLLPLISTTLAIEATSLRGEGDNSYYERSQNNGDKLSRSFHLIGVEESPTATSGHATRDHDDVNIYFRRTQAPTSSVQKFSVKLVFQMLYVDEATADVLSKGRQSDSIVHRLCSAVNIQVSSSVHCILFVEISKFCL